MKLSRHRPPDISLPSGRSDHLSINHQCSPTLTSLHNIEYSNTLNTENAPTRFYGSLQKPNHPSVKVLQTSVPISGGDTVNIKIHRCRNRRTLLITSFVHILSKQLHHHLISSLVASHRTAETASKLSPQFTQIFNVLLKLFRTWQQQSRLNVGCSIRCLFILIWGLMTNWT